jgi:hypothetical protein
MWEGVDYLFIDEISMVGCAFLLQISQALTEAKGNTAPFGGVNLIFAGDFAQLPPVGEKSLFAKIDTSTESASGKKGQQNILGKLLWLSVKTVVKLKKIERVRRRCSSTREPDERDLEAENFVDLLSRLRCNRSCSPGLSSQQVTLRPNQLSPWTTAISNRDAGHDNPEF